MSTGECLVCGEALSEGWRVTCAKCQTPHHRDCFQYNGRCAVYACGSTKSTDGDGRGVPMPHPVSAPDVVIPPGTEPRPAGAILYDFTSGTERLCRAGILVGLAIAGAAPLFGLDPARFLQDPWFTIGGVIAVLGVIASVSIEDTLLVDPDTRTIRLRRDILGLSRSWPLYRFDQVRALRLERTDRTFGTLHESRGAHTCAWLTLELVSGARVRLGDVHGTPGWDPRKDLLRIGRRIAVAIDVPFREPQRADEDPGVSYHVPYLIAKLAWFFAMVVAVRWVLLMIRGQLDVEHPLGYALTLAGGLFAAHVWFLARPLGTMGADRQVAMDRLIEAYTSKKTHRSSETPGPLVALILTLVGLALLMGAVHAFFEDLRANAYFRPVKAKYVSSQVIEVRENKRTRYAIQLHYRYSVGRAEFEGSRRASSTYSTKSDASRHLNDRIGDETTVYYDPLFHGVSRTSNEFPWLILLGVVGALLMFEMGLRFYSRLLAIAIASEDS